jgi:hypothetical protein
MPDDEVRAQLDRLKSMLETRADQEMTRLSIHGKALSKSEDSLHLATQSGIVAIPFSQIEAVVPSSTTDERYVRVDVRNGSEVRTLLRASTATPLPTPIPTPGQPPGLLLRRSVIEAGNTFTGGDCEDTATITGGDLDATDDAICGPDSMDDILT